MDCLMIPFTKMNGAGNDFVMIDNRALDRSLDAGLIARICDRHRGVGADGLLLVEPASGSAHFRMRYYNSDGGEAEMCGNGARCFAKFAQRLSDLEGSIRFETMAGLIDAHFVDDQVRLDMGIPRDIRLGECVEVDGEPWIVHSLNTGVPHAVLIINDLEHMPVDRVGAGIRYHLHFAPRGTNVNFLQALAPDHIAIRTYERGVEGETLACGTGIVASAIAYVLTTNGVAPVKVNVRGGDTLLVTFKREDDRISDVTLTGPADFVFEGTLLTDLT